MLYHYKGYLIVYSGVNQKYTVYLDNVKTNPVDTLGMATFIIDLATN